MSDAITIPRMMELVRGTLASPVRQPAMLIEGPPGCGKTAGIRQVVEDTGATLYVPLAPTLLPVEPAGIIEIPGAGADRARRLPVGEFAAALLDHSPDRPAVLLLDELGQADEDVQKACRRLLHRLDGNLPPWVHVMAATNRRQDRSGARGMLAHVRSAVRTIQVRWDPDSWTRWAVTQQHIPPAMIAHARWRGEAWVAAEVPPSDQPFPTARGWESAACAEALGVDEELTLVAMSGDVGEPAALDYLAFRSLYVDAVYSDEVYAAPLTAPLPAPDKPAMCAGLMASLAARFAGTPTPSLANSLAEYLMRLVDGGRAEYAAFAVNQARQSREAAAALSMSRAGQALAAHPNMGALISGVDL